MYNRNNIVHAFDVVAPERFVGGICKSIRFSAAVINDGFSLCYGHGDGSQFSAAQMASTGNWNKCKFSIATKMAIILA